jgi:hypothetical protein
MMVAGSHQVVAVKPGFQTRTIALTVERGGTATLDVNLEPMTGTIEAAPVRTWIPYSIASAGALVVGLAIPLQLVARSNYDDYDELVAAECPRGCPMEQLSSRARTKYDQARFQNRAAITGFIVGGTLLAGGVVWALLNRPRVVEKPGVVVTAASGEVSVWLEGTF